MSNYSGSQLPRSFIHILYVAPHDGLGTRRDKHMPHAAAEFLAFCEEEKMQPNSEARAKFAIRRAAGLT